LIFIFVTFLLKKKSNQKKTNEKIKNLYPYSDRPSPAEILDRTAQAE